MSDALNASREPVGSTDINTCRKVEALLLGDLQTLLSRPRRSTTRDELLGLLKFLEFNLRRQSSLSAGSVNLAAAARRDPSFHTQWHRLHCQIERCREHLEEIRIRVLVAPSFAAIASEVRTDLRHWMARMLKPAQLNQQQLLPAAVATELGGAA